MENNSKSINKVKRWSVIVTLVLFLLIWELLVLLLDLPAFILPTPTQVTEAFYTRCCGWLPLASQCHNLAGSVCGPSMRGVFRYIARVHSVQIEIP